jgi:hypothetical protein
MKENNLNVEDCNSLSSKINLFSNFGVGAKDLVIFYKEQYSKQNCDNIKKDSAYKELDKVTEKYQNIDKERIETESFTQRNYRLILGAVVLVTGLLIIVTIKKD